MVGVVGRPQMLFMEAVKGAFEWHQGQTEAVAGGTMVLVPPSTAS